MPPCCRSLFKKKSRASKLCVLVLVGDQRRYCTTVVALFWTVDMVVTARTGFYQAGAAGVEGSSAMTGT